MTEAIIVAVLALLGNVVVSWMSNRKSTALITYRIDQLEGKVNKHNNLIERTYELEKHMAVVENEIKTLESYHEGE